MSRDLVLAIHDSSQGLSSTAIGKGGVASYQHEQDHSKTPYIWEGGGGGGRET